jgi:hypothetical protein
VNKPNYKLHGKHIRMYDNQKHVQRGVNKPRCIGGMDKTKFGESALGYQIKAMQGPNPEIGSEGHWVVAIMIHVETLMELESMPAPKLKGI